MRNSQRSLIWIPIWKYIEINREVNLLWEPSSNQSNNSPILCLLTKRHFVYLTSSNGENCGSRIALDMRGNMPSTVFFDVFA